MDTNQVSTCSALSNNINEPLYATVSPNRFWFMLEVDRPWGAKALLESNLSSEVLGYLSEITNKLDSSRVLLLRQPTANKTSVINFFIAIADEINPALYAFSLEKYENLLDLNLPELVQNPQGLAENISDKAIYLVCTNGRRDPCCASNGLPVYQSLAQTFGSAVWQTSHVGGHRFSANLVCMPHALFYGRVDPTSASELVSSYEQGKMIKEHYRGRACYPKPIQAAEYFVRNHYKVRQISALKLLDFLNVSENENVSIVLNEQTGEKYTTRIRYKPEAYSILSSCRDTQNSSTPAYTLLKIEKS